MYPRLLLLFLIFVQLQFAFAQDLGVRNFSVNQGLSQSTVNGLIQDKQGYLWISTGHGLNRYDGYEFKTFFNNSADSNSISYNNVRNMLEDTIRNVLWVGTEVGLNCYNPVTGRFSNILKGHPQLEKIYSAPLFYTQNELWFFSGGQGICIYHFDTKTAEIKIRFRVNKDVYFIPQLQQLAFQKESSYMYLYSLSSGKMDSLKLPFEYPGDNVYNMSYFADTRLLLFTEDGFYLVDTDTKKLEEYVPFDLLRHKDILTACTDHKGLQYFSVRDEGIYVFDKNKQLVKRFTEVMNVGSPDEFSFQKVRQLLVDRSGNVWAGSDGAGLIKIGFSNMHFQPVEIKMTDTETGYFNEFVRSINEIGEKLWVGTSSKGLFIINRKTNETQQVLVEKPDSSYLALNSINRVRSTSKGLLVATDRGLYLADTTNMTFSKLSFFHEPERKKIYDILESKIHGILVVSSSGVYQLTVDGNKYILSAFLDHGLNVSKIFEDAQGNIWLGYPRYGIKKLKPDRTLEEWTLKKDTISWRLGLTINCFEQTGESIWASSNMGLWELDADIKILNRYNETAGLCNNFIYGILKDTLGNLWLSTNKGISCFNIKNKTFRNYGLEDGLRSMEHNSGAYYKSTRGDFYFGGIRGLNYFNPYILHDNPLPPRVVLTQFNLLDDEYAPADTLFSAKRVFSFDYHQNTFSVEISALDFTNPLKNQYAFYLEGFDQQFYNTGSKRFIRYSNLEPGVYTLWCKASNSDGVWSQQQKLFSVVIAPPFWKTVWFRTLVAVTGVVLLSLTIFLLVQWGYRKKVRELQRQQDIERVRLRISKDIHDEVGAGLTRIALMSEAAKIEHGKNIDVGNKFGHVSETARKMTAGLHEIIWSVNPVYDNLDALLSYISNYAYEFFEDTDVIVSVQFPQHIPVMAVPPDFRRNLFLIVKEALNNSAKHSCAKNITLKCSLDEKIFAFEISDNGKGFKNEMSENKFSSGLKNMQRRAEEIKLRFRLHSEKDKGTHIVLTGKFLLN
ncbi:MAG: two-component regulator propeller domain-containing protein [Bacteroidia bacterium]